MEEPYQVPQYPALQEYPIETNFQNCIPQKAQKGLSNFDLELTCLDADEGFIAIGCNVGVVYLYDRMNGSVQKLKDNEHKSSVTCVKVCVSLECLVAIGFQDGALLVYKVLFHESKFERFTVQGLHSCAITALEWSKNALQFFSGDESGLVVCTEIDHLEHLSKSRKLTQENTKVVQISYSHQTLVISTLIRSLIYYLQTDSSVQIGQKERKCFGPFGALIFDLKKSPVFAPENSTIFASRPGQRLWKSDLSGNIQETMIFKTLLLTSSPSIKMEVMSNENPCYTDHQFGHLFRYMSCVLVWSDAYLLLIDPASKLIVGLTPKLDQITDVAVASDEIFLLQGTRQLLRIASKPDPYGSVKVMQEPSVFEDILVPLKELKSYISVRSESFSVTLPQNPSLFDWLKKKRSTSSPVDFNQDIESIPLEMRGINNSEPLPDIVPLDLNDDDPGKPKEFPKTDLDPPPEIITKDFSIQSDADDIVFKVKKKNRKQKKVKFDVDAAPKRERFKSKASKNIPAYKDDKSDLTLKSSAVFPQNGLEEDNKESNKEETPNRNNGLSKTTDSNENPLPAEINACLSAKNNNMVASDCVDSTHLTSHGISEKPDTDPDSLLESVLSAYSHLKQNMPPNDTPSGSGSNNSLTSSIADDTTENNDNETRVSDLQVGISSNNVLDAPKSPDADEVYSLVLSPLSQDLKNSNTPPSAGLSNSLTADSPDGFLESQRQDPPKYGVNWVEYKAPENLQDVSISNEHIFCVDVRNRLFFSKLPLLGSLHWIELSQPAEKVAASATENIVWVLYKGTVFVAAQRARSLWVNAEWISVAREVVSIAVDDDSAWYAKSSGELFTQQGLTAANPSSYPESVSCQFPALEIAVKNGVLWVLTAAGSLLVKNVKNKNFKSKWKEVKVKNVPYIDVIFLGPLDIGWIVDCAGMIYFMTNVTAENPGGTGGPWLVEVSDYLYQPLTSMEQIRKRALRSEVLTSLIHGKQKLCLAACDTCVWFCKTHENVLFSNQKSVIGHQWEMVIPPSTASVTKWKLIAADGIMNSEGALWCVNSNNELFCFDIKKHIFSPVELPSPEGIQCLQPKSQSLWLLTEKGSIFVRREITSSCLQGIWWQPLDLSQLEMQDVVHVSCSTTASWACTSDGEILMRLGSLNPSAAKLNQAWVSVGTANEEATSPIVKFSAIGKHFPLPLLPSQSLEENSQCKVYVGPLGYPVWSLDRRRNVYVREGVTSELPVGDRWVLVPELRAKDLCITRNAVWLLKSSGKIYRRFGVTEKNPFGDYWKQIPGQMEFLSATEDDDLWGLRAESMFCHHSNALYNASEENKKAPNRMISEDGWEDIMEEFDD